MQARNDLASRAPGDRRRAANHNFRRLAAAALLLTFSGLACSERDARAPAGPVAPDLAAKTSCSSSPRPTYPGELVAGQQALIADHLCGAGNLSPANAQSALVKWVAIIRQAPDASTARVLSLIDFVSKNWLEGPADPDLASFESDLLLVVFGVDVPDDVPVTVRDIPASGLSLCDDDGFSCYTFPPGWSATDRLLISYPIDCDLVSDELPIYGACEHRETVPQGFFLIPVTLVQCFLGDENLVTPILVKRLEAAFNDPLGTDVLDLELFLNSAGASPPPACVAASQALAAPAGGVAQGSGLRQAGGKLGGPNGLGLQLRGVGGQVSAFSDWAFTALEEIPRTVEGVISNSSTAGAIAGAQVELLCEADVAARQSTLSAADGSYAFDGDATSGGFEVGDTCVVRASAAGFVSASTASFEVDFGGNEQGLALDPLQASATTVSGTIRHSPSSCTGPECSSTLVGGADVFLSCTTSSGSSFSDVTTTGNEGGSSSFGRYAFTRAAPGFGPGWTCTVTASFGTESGSAGPVAIQSGTNTIDLRIF